MLRVRVFSYLQLHAETVNEQLYQWLVVDLEVNSLVGDLLYEDLQLNSGTVLGVDELPDGIVEFVRIAKEVDIEVPELVEDELFPLPILQEKQSNQVLVAEIHEFLSGKTRTVTMFLLTEVLNKHKLVHGGIQSNSLVGIPSQLVLLLENLDNQSR